MLYQLSYFRIERCKYPFFIRFSKYFQTKTTHFLKNGNPAVGIPVYEPSAPVRTARKKPLSPERNVNPFSARRGTLPAELLRYRLGASASSLFLLFEQFALAADIAAVTLGRHILRTALTVSRAMILAPMAACIAISNC